MRKPPQHNIFSKRVADKAGWGLLSGFSTLPQIWPIFWFVSLVCCCSFDFSSQPASFATSGLDLWECPATSWQAPEVVKNLHRADIFDPFLPIPGPFCIVRCKVPLPIGWLDTRERGSRVRKGCWLAWTFHFRGCPWLERRLPPEQIQIKATQYEGLLAAHRQRKEESGQKAEPGRHWISSK